MTEEILHIEGEQASRLPGADEAARMLRALLRYANDLVYFVSIDPEARTWRLEFLGDRIFELSGCRPDEFVKGGPIGTGGPFGLAKPREHPFELLHPDDLERTMKQTRALSQGQAVVREYRLKHRDSGEYRWVEDRSRPETDDRGRVVGIWGIVRDIEDRRRLEQDLLQAQKMEAIGRLAGGIAHDFNNILTVILGLTETMIQDVRKGGGNGARLDDLEDVRTEAGRAAALTQQLLAFSRKQLMQPRTMSLRSCVDDMKGMLERIIGEDIEVEIRTRESSSVWADPTQIQQILMNLVINAREAMPAGGRLVIETSDVDVGMDGVSEESGSGRYVVLAVSDTGVGMDEHTLAHAFDPFFSTRSGGTGLGLSTVYGIAKQSGGHVRARSEPSRGTTVEVLLPRAESGVPEAPGGGTEREDGELRGKETVLIVEDESGVRRLMRRVLTSYGYRVLEASGGTEACRVLEASEDSIDLLLTDVVMPGMGGPEVARRARELRPGIRVLYTSGYTGEFIEHEGKGLDLEGRLVEKPFTRTGLAGRVREALDA